MKKDLEIWVFGDHRHYPQDRLTLQVLGKARALSGDKGRVTVILLGHQVEGIVREYIAHGAQRILLVDHPQLAFYRTDLFTAVISDLIQEHQPEVFLLGTSEFGMELAARISKRLGVGLSADCVSLDWDGQRDRLIASSPAFGGNFLARIVWSLNRPYMATVSSGTFPERPYDKNANGEIVRIDKIFNERSSKISVISSVHEASQASKLEDAKIVVAGGRGVKNLEGFNYLRELALLLGAEVGATRPAVDAHWTSHEQLIGQTGRSIKPELLITCGTSGAVQYTAALQGAGTIVAINRDSRATIFTVADIGVVADAQSFLPAFITEIKNHLFREITDLYRTQVKTGKDQRSVTFGQRIKKLREDHKMSVMDLAEKTGQPPEFIEQVESDSLTPPVSFLLQLSQALKIDPSNFLTEQEKVQIDGKRQEGFIKRTQNYSYRTLTPGAADKRLRAFMVTIEPREAHKMIEYKHPGEEFIFVYKGELELTLGGKVFHLKQGETIHFDSETKHKLRNISDEKCELLVTLYTP
ncbi:MAG: FAD-binding protein [Thermodesulfobacteriota bacterium]|nr:FAD-binding protein [Thermodesulfobacteriota bacterium]